MAEEIDGAEEGLPGAGMRQEAVRTVDGRADGWGTEEAVCRAVGQVDGQRTADGTKATVRRAVDSADGRGDGGGHPLRNRLRGWPPGGRWQGQTLGQTPVGTAASIRRAVGLADSHLGKTAVCRAIGYADRRADSQRTARRMGRQTSTGRNGHLQHREYKTPPSAENSSFYPRVKLTKS